MRARRIGCSPLLACTIYIDQFQINSQYFVTNLFAITENDGTLNGVLQFDVSISHVVTDCEVCRRIGFFPFMGG